MKTAKEGSEEAKAIWAKLQEARKIAEEPEKEKPERSTADTWFSERKAALQEIHDQEQNLGKSTQELRQIDIEYWQGVASQTEQGSEHWKQAYHEIQAARRQMLDDQRTEDERAASDQKSAQLVQLEAERQHQQAVSALQLEAIRTKAELGEISANDALQMELDIEARSYEAAQRALWQKLELDNLELKEKARVYAQITALQDQQALKQQQTLDRQAIETKRKFDNLWDSVNNAAAGAFTGMLSKTQTWQQSVGRILDSMMNRAIITILREGEIWAMNEIRKTAATTAGETARAGIKTTAAAEGAAAETASGLSTIMKDAYKAGAGAYAATVDIPIIGPILAPAAAAVSFAAVAAFGSGLASAEYGYDIPAGVNPLVKAHAEEMVLPAEISNRIRRMTEPEISGGAASAIDRYGNVTIAPQITVNAIDKRGVEGFLRNNSGTLVKIMQEAHRDFKFNRKS